MSKQPLWKCPRCGRRFANRNQSHWCAPLTPLSAHFKGKSPAVRRLYRAFVAAVRQAARSKRGSVKILSEKSCIGFQARITFATIAVQKSTLRGHLVLARPVRDRRFLRVLSPSPRNHIHDYPPHRPQAARPPLPPLPSRGLCRWPTKTPPPQKRVNSSRGTRWKSCRWRSN